MSHLPTVDAAGAIATGLCEHLTAPEQAMFIAGFQEAIKYLNQEVESPAANQADDDDDEITDDDARALWRSIGGTFYGPKIEHGNIVEAKLLPFLKQVIESRKKHQSLLKAADIVDRQLVERSSQRVEAPSFDQSTY